MQLYLSKYQIMFRILSYLLDYQEAIISLAIIRIVKYVYLIEIMSVRFKNRKVLLNTGISSEFDSIQILGFNLKNSP